MTVYHRARTLLTVVPLLLILSRSGAAENLAQESPVKPLRATAAAPNFVACSPDGKRYVFATPDGRIRYARAEDGATLRTFYHCSPQRVVFSADGRFLASAGKSCGGLAKLKIWKVTDGTLICQMKTDVGSDLLLSFSPDGKWLASDAAGSCINLWELPTGILKQSLKIDHAISRISFAERSRSVVAICADGKVRKYSGPGIEP